MITAATPKVSTARTRSTRVEGLRLITTRACPLLCGFCSVSAGPGRREMMDSNAADRLLRQFASQGGSEITLTGGEPLIHPAIDQLAGTAQELGLDVTLFTMGLVDGGRELPAQRITQLVPFTQRWRFSLHGATDDAHDRITGMQGSFHASVSTIARLVEAGAWVGATFVVRPDALQELSPVAQMCGELGIRELRVVSVVAQGRQVRSPGQLPRTEILSAIEAADELSGVKVRLGDAALAQLGLPNTCQAFDNELVVSVDGWVSACHVIEPSASHDDRDNVFRTGLARTLHESPRLAQVRAMSVECGGSCRDGCLMERSVRAPLVATSMV